jgi:glycosyltransferase involved in cell wall biosynthesis
MDYPKISIVTPSYNQDAYLEETILSIINQNYPNLEYVIIDGGSTDGSVEIIKKYESVLRYWVSEKDSGQVDAINKGLLHCTGDIFNWINSDDVLTKGALFELAKNWKKGFCVAGQVRNFYQDSSKDGGVHPNRITSLSEFIALKSKYHQPGLWFDLMQLRNNLPINTESSYYFDKILMIDFFFKNGVNIIEISSILVNFRVHQDSKTILIQNSLQHELVSFYESLLNNKNYQTYFKIIKKTLNQHIIPYQLIKQWRTIKGGKLKKAYNYLIIGIKNTHILKSRLYYTILKNEVL